LCQELLEGDLPCWPPNGSYGGGFDCINAAAALTKYAKLPGSSMSSTLFDKLADA
jgi:hypothetical protein